MRESLKPIEPGCLALVRSLDRPVFVARAAEKAVWRTPEHPRHAVWWLEHDAPGESAACECALIRIDPDEEQRKAWEDEQRASDCGVDLFLDGLAAKIRELDR